MPDLHSQLDWPLDLPVRHAEKRPDAIAFACGEDTLSWAQLKDAVSQRREVLSAMTGQTVTLIGRQHLAFVVDFLALIGICRVLPLSERLPQAELNRLMRQAGSSLSINPDRQISRPEDNRCSDTATHKQSAPGLLLASSGTTGLPKLVFRSAKSLEIAGRTFADAAGLRSDDTVLACVPLTHSYGLEHGLLAPLHAGCSVELETEFDPMRLGEALDRTGASVLPAVPVVFEMLLTMWQQPLPQLRLTYSAGAPLPESVWQRCHDELGLEIGQLYGTTEVGSVICQMPGALKAASPCAAGYPMPGVQLRVLDADAPDWQKPLPPECTGEIAVLSPWQMQGYIDHPPLSKPFLTGDLGHQDTSGCLHVTGRKKLLIDVGGSKVNPLEVESFLGAQPGVTQCLVLPDPVSDTVCRLQAWLIWDDNAGTFDARAIRANLRHQLASHKVPRQIKRVRSFPTSPTGKILRGEILQAISQ